MTYKIIITDDSPEDIIAAQEMAEEWAKERGITIEISSFSSGEEFLFHFEDDRSCDVIILDIEMSGIDGVSIARKIRAINKNISIVFVTGYSDYIAEGYEVAALHYLMKPINRAKFFRTLDRALEQSLRNMQYLTLETHDSVERVSFPDIRWLEVRQNYVTVHADADYTVKKTLGEFEKMLSSDNSFCRVGRSYIVNLRYIARVTRTEICLLDSTVIPLPRGMYDMLNKEIIKRL